MKMRERFIAWLLGVANSGPPPLCRTEFYDLKLKLLKRFGRLECEATLFGDRPLLDVQHITLPCWRCEGSGTDEIPDDICRKCEGTGIYREYWVLHERWRIGNRVMHNPVERRYTKPERPVAIEGKITKRGGKNAREAWLWLALLFDRKTLFERELNGKHCYVEWSWHPLLNVQRLLCSRWRFRRRFWREECCLCGNPFWRKSSVAGSCRRCEGEYRASIDETPF